MTVNAGSQIHPRNAEKAPLGAQKGGETGCSNETETKGNSKRNREGMWKTPHRKEGDTPGKY